jgi:hypothetical protein
MYMLLRVQHQDVQVHGMLSVQSRELLPQVGMLQELLFLPGSLLLLHVQLLHV